MPSPRERWRLGRLDLRCLAVLVWYRLLLALLRYRTINRWHAAPPDTPRESVHYARQIAARVRYAARLVPGARCLAQALAVRYLLARSGHRVEIMIGVAPATETQQGPIRAHAWLECQGTTIAVGDDLGHFTPLLRIG